MNNRKSKNKKTVFVLSDVIKRKILEMYKIPNPKITNKKTSDIINNSAQTSNTK